MSEPRQCRGRVQLFIGSADPDMTPPEGHVYVVVAVRSEELDPGLIFKRVRVVEDLHVAGESEDA